jgi:hypothetical protein
MEAATFNAMKKNMTTLRKQITRATNSLTTIVNSSDSRRSAKALVVHLDDLILKTSILQTEIAAMEENEHEAERQESLHLTYVSKCDDIIAAAQSYLASREGEAESVINLRNEPIDPPEPNPFLPIRSLSGVARREQAHEEEVAAAQRKCEEMKAIWADVEAAEENLRLLKLRRHDDDNLTSISQLDVIASARD